MKRNKKWDSEIVFTTPQEISARRKMFDSFAKEHPRQKISQIPKQESEQQNASKYKSVSVIWADSNPNIGVT